MRWIVGDLQGCVRELEDLVRAIGFDPAKDELWCAGDVVNRGPESLETLRLFHDLGARTVLGNHDIHALAARAGIRRPRPGKDTLDALLAAPDVDRLLAPLWRAPALQWLPSGGDGPDAWLVHAGLHPAWHDVDAVAQRLASLAPDTARLEHPDVIFAATVRCCDEAGARHRGTGPTCDDGFAPWDQYYGGETLVVHGHWATLGHYRGRHARTLGLDSGCVYGGPLTAWCQDEDRIVQVPSRQPRRHG